MNTSDLALGSAPADASDDVALALAKQIELLANRLMVDGAPPGVTSPVLAPAAPPMQQVSAAPVMPTRVAPSAMSVGAAGVTPSLTAPPVAGVLASPPVASAPPPRESDFRSVATFMSESVGLSAPLSVAQPEGAALEVPYFLTVAGLPGAASVDAPSVAAPRAVPSVPGPGLGVPSSGLPPAPAAPVSPVDAPFGESLTRAIASLGSNWFEPRLVEGLDLPHRPFDANAIKQDFPILRERVHGKPLVWLDNAATTQKPKSVIDRLAYYYEHENSNVHRGAHTLAARATDAYESARASVRRFLGAPSVEEILFVRGATEAINLVAKSWGRRHVHSGDEILITWLEHHANIVPWQQLCAEVGAKLCVGPVDDRGQVILEEIDKLISPKTRLVAIPQVSNALGTVVPVREIIQMAHREGALALIDGAQAVSHMPVDVADLGCDFYCFSGHKVFAPTGIGALFVRREVLETMPPWQGGGNMIRDVTFEKTVYERPPYRYEAGTASIGDAAGLDAAIEYVTGIGLEAIARYEHELLDYATGRLLTIPGLQIIGTAKEKAGVISFVLPGVRTEDVGSLLDQEGIAVRSGHHCAQPILRRFGLESTVRASFAPYNTCEDVDALVRAIERIRLHQPAPPL
ncbi:MAG: SufS family cysteine desulfurase [Polyangiaceae bacterium]|jgi:cysteine desulfurase/selenocysteine lyase